MSLLSSKTKKTLGGGKTSSRWESLSTDRQLLVFSLLTVVGLIGKSMSEHEKCAHAHHRISIGDYSSSSFATGRGGEGDGYDAARTGHLSSSSESCPSADELCPSSDSKRRVRDSAIQIELKRKKIEVEELQRALAKKNGNGSKEDPLAKELETMSSELAKLRAKLRTYKVSEQQAISDRKNCEKTLEYGGDGCQRQELPIGMESCEKLAEYRKGLEKKIITLKREAWTNRDKSANQCAGKLAAERLLWMDRATVVMTAAIAAGTDERTLDSTGIIQTEARRRVLAAEREIAYSKKYPGSPVFNGVGSAANEADLSIVFKRALLEARNEMLAEDKRIDEAWIDELLQIPELNGGKRNGAKRWTPDERQKHSEEWEEAVRKLTPSIVEGVQVKTKNPKDVINYFARTVEAERAMPHVFGLVERKGGPLQWEGKFARYAARKNARRSKNVKGGVVKKADGNSTGVSNTLFRSALVDDVLPDVAPPPEYKRCALVGNSQRNLIHEYGEEIDSHDTVFRMNNGPTLGFEKYVGTKTTHRIVNNLWTKAYGASVYNLARLPLEWNATLLVSRTDGEDFYNVVSELKNRRPDVNVVRINPPGAAAASDLLDTLRKRIESKRGLTYPGRGSPSSGWLAVFLAIQLCESVDVYGVGLGGCWGAAGGGCIGGSAWHYFENDLAELYKNSREFGEDPHHSFQLEHDMLRALDEASHIKLHAPQKYDSMEKEATYLRAMQPTVLDDAQATARTLSAKADLICIASVGQTCGCEKRCMSPTELHNREKKSRMKEATQVIKSLERYDESSGSSSSSTSGKSRSHDGDENNEDD